MEVWEVGAVWYSAPQNPNMPTLISPWSGVEWSGVAERGWKGWRQIS